MEDLLVRRVGRAADHPTSGHLFAPEVLDVGEDVGGLTVELVVLPSVLRRDMRRDARVGDGVLLTCVVVNPHSPEHEEAVACVQLPGQVPQLGVERG